MTSNWQDCKHILCIRPDNMGDLLMSGPALRALKETYSAKITVLTSTMAAGIARLMPEIDDVIVFDLPWVKTATTVDNDVFKQTIKVLKTKKFDAAIIFTVYSQNPLPTVMLAYLAGIPRRLAYCRENPYQLLTDWVPDTEPYTNIKHQVQRDLDLVATIGATTLNKKLNLTVDVKVKKNVIIKLIGYGINLQQPWLILHPGVSEIKREYPEELWIAAGKRIIKELGYQLLITGSAAERSLIERLSNAIGSESRAMGGVFSLPEFIALIQMAPILISVNTGTVHIAAAVATPVLVLYAQTNPQHTPWEVPNVVLPFSITKEMQSKNEIIKYVHEQLYKEQVRAANDSEILVAVNELLYMAGKAAIKALSA